MMLLAGFKIFRLLNFADFQVPQTLVLTLVPQTLVSQFSFSI